MSTLGDMINAGLAVCHTGVQGNENLFLGLFLTGLAGSLGHCAGMCGPFVLSQVAARLEAIPLARMTELRRLGGAALLPYHLGRATTYAALGAASASFAGVLGGAPGFKWLGGGLLIGAALLLVAMTLPALKGLAGGGDSAWAARVGAWARPLFAKPFGWRGWLLGVMLGFIPCGLLYAALTAAAAGGNAIAGAAGMLAFVAGTVPTLVLVATVGHAALGKWRSLPGKAAPVLLLLNAAVLGMMAWGLLSQ